MYTYIHNIYICVYLAFYGSTENQGKHFNKTTSYSSNSRGYYDISHFQIVLLGSKYVWPPFLARFLEGMLKHPSSKDALFWEGLKKRFHIVWSSQTWTERSKIIRLFIPLRSGYSWPAGCLDFWAYILVLLAQNPRI